MKGGLGNVMFQIASIFSYAKKHNLVFRISHKQLQKVGLLDYVDFDGLGVIVEDADLYPEDCAIKFAEDAAFLPSLSPDFRNVVLNGYFQNEILFCDYEADIRRMYRKLTNPEKLCGSVCLHVRLGDFKIQPDRHWNINSAYVLECLKLCKNRDTLYITTDDINTCTVRLAGIVLRLESMFNSVKFIAEPEWDVIKTLQHMTRCEEFIGNASSLSWWGAYLGKANTVCLGDSSNRVRYDGSKMVNKSAPVTSKWHIITDPVMGAPVPDASYINPVVIGMFTGDAKSRFYWWYENMSSMVFPNKRKIFYIYTDDTNLSYCEADDRRFLKKLMYVAPKNFSDTVLYKWCKHVSILMELEMRTKSNFVFFVDSRFRWSGAQSTNFLTKNCNFFNGKSMFVCFYKLPNSSVFTVLAFGGFIPTVKKFCTEYMQFLSNMSVFEYFDKCKSKDNYVSVDNYFFLPFVKKFFPDEVCFVDLSVSNNVL